MSEKLEEGKIGKWLTAPIRRSKLIKKVEANAKTHRAKRDGATDVADKGSESVKWMKNYKDTESRAATKEVSKMVKDHRDRAAKEGKITAKRSMTAYNLTVGKKSKALGANKDLKEMNKIQEGIKAIQDKNLEQMRENFNDALARKAAEALQEKKLEIASSYFGK